ARTTGWARRAAGCGRRGPRRARAARREVPGHAPGGRPAGRSACSGPRGVRAVTGRGGGRRAETWQLLPFLCGLRYHGGDTAAGAQTVRRGGAGPAGGLLGGKDPTGRLASPLIFSLPRRRRRAARLTAA